LVFFVLYNLGDQKKYLPFHMGRYGSPALLIAMDRLDRCSQKLGHLPLGLFQFIPEMFEFRAVHMSSHILTIAAQMLKVNILVPQGGMCCQAKNGPIPPQKSSVR